MCFAAVTKCWPLLGLLYSESVITSKVSHTPQNEDFYFKCGVRVNFQKIKTSIPNVEIGLISEVFKCFKERNLFF